jgi:hypothetical protein
MGTVNIKTIMALILLEEEEVFKEIKQTLAKGDVPTWRRVELEKRRDNAIYAVGLLKKLLDSEAES